MTFSISSIDGKSGRYAFIDLGSGTGGSLQHCLQRFGRGPGLGFELDPSEAAEAQRAGLEVVEADVRVVQVADRSVDFVSAMDFLEHLPDAATAASVLEKFGQVARHFLFIRHPSFEEKDYLTSLGLKFSWSDWSGHPNMMLMDDYRSLFRRFGWTDYAIYPRNLVVDSMDEHMVPLSAPIDTIIYDPNVLAPKPLIVFDRPIFGQYDIFVRREGLSVLEWEQLLRAEMDAGAPAWSAKMYSVASPEPKAVSAEFGFYNPKTSDWTLRGMDGNERRVRYGSAGQGLLPLLGNFGGRGSGLGLYDPATGTFFLRNTVDEGAADQVVGFGPRGAVPICGNWIGTGSDTIGIYLRETGQWCLRYQNTTGPADETFSFGPSNTNWLPVVGDWDGDGRDSVGIYDPASGALYLKAGNLHGRSDKGFTAFPPGGLPFVGDWDGDGRDSVGIYVPNWGLWILNNANLNRPADLIFSHPGEGTPVTLPGALAKRG